MSVRRVDMARADSVVPLRLSIDPEPHDGTVLLTDVLDLLRGVLLRGDPLFSRQWIELLANEAPSVYVVGLDTFRWAWIKTQTTVRGRQLPRDLSPLRYGGLELPRLAVGDPAECFLLSGLLCIMHELVQGDNTDLAVQLLKNVNTEAHLAYVVGLCQPTWRQLKERIMRQFPQPLPENPFLSTNMRTMRVDDHAYRPLDGEDASQLCWMGMEAVPRRRVVSTRSVPPDVLLHMPELQNNASEPLQ
eukprot:TRINITY_DN8583_c0_g1_i3.p1 TRINITY_DN8583_c0_g1~~TRINITY_DN8583_c0_g1_i3.p1  ORF type:complete len:261 (+),score=23.68 TRINITY_DN8583_c0_g1_i3:46-783(+)